MDFESLYSLDIIVVVYVTDHIDIETIHIYGSGLTDEEVSEQAYKCIKATHPQGEDAMDGFEVLTIVR